MIHMARGRMMLLTGVNLLIIFHLCQAQTSPATDIVTTVGIAATTGAVNLVTTDAATTTVDRTTANVPTTRNSPTTVAIIATTSVPSLVTDAATTMDKTIASIANVPTTEDSQTTKETSTKSMDITDTPMAPDTPAAGGSNDPVAANSTEEVMSMNTTTPGNSTTTTGRNIAIVAASIILGFMLCTGCCLFLLSDWSCTQPPVAGNPRCCSCSCFRCFSQQDFGDSSKFSPARSESHEVLEMETTGVTEVGSFTNTSTLHWSTGNHHSFHKYMAPQNLNNDEGTSPSTTEDREDRGNNFRGVIAMLSDDRNAGSSKKYSEAINLDIFQQGEDETGRDSPMGDEVSYTSNHTQMTVVSIHAPEHNERPSPRSSISDPSAGGVQQEGTLTIGSHQELASAWTEPKVPRSQERKKGFYMNDSEVSEDSKNRSYSQNVAEAMRTFDTTIQYNEEEEGGDPMMTTEL